MSNELKPCPFCGSHPTVNEDNMFWEFGGHERQDSSVNCESCGLDLIEYASDKRCSCCNDLTAIVIDRWNSRFIVAIDPEQESLGNLERHNEKVRGDHGH